MSQGKTLEYRFEVELIDCRDVAQMFNKTNSLTSWKVRTCRSSFLLIRDYLAFATWTTRQGWTIQNSKKAFYIYKRVAKLLEKSARHKKSFDNGNVIQSARTWRQKSIALLCSQNAFTRTYHVKRESTSTSNAQPISMGQLIWRDNLAEPGYFGRKWAENSSEILEDSSKQSRFGGSTKWSDRNRWSLPHEEWTLIQRSFIKSIFLKKRIIGVTV